MTDSFNPKKGLIVVPVKLKGPAGDWVVQLALDTGATDTMVSKGALQILGYDSTQAMEWKNVTTGSGVVTVPRVRVARIDALASGRRNFAVLAHTLPPTATVDGVLGLDFLRARRLILDFRKGSIKLD